MFWFNIDDIDGNNVWGLFMSAILYPAAFANISTPDILGFTFDMLLSCSLVVEVVIILPATAAADADEVVSWFSFFNIFNNVCCAACAFIFVLVFTTVICCCDEVVVVAVFLVAVATAPVILVSVLVVWAVVEIIILALLVPWTIEFLRAITLEVVVLAGIDCDFIFFISLYSFCLDTNNRSVHGHNRPRNAEHEPCNPLPPINSSSKITYTLRTN